MVRRTAVEFSRFVGGKVDVELGVKVGLFELGEETGKQAPHVGLVGSGRRGAVDVAAEQVGAVSRRSAPCSTSPRGSS